VIAAKEAATSVFRKAAVVIASTEVDQETDILS